MLRFALRDPLRDAAGEGTGGGGGTPAAFDPAAFAAQLMGEVNKTLNGFAKTLKADIGKLTAAPTPAAAATTDPDPTPATDPATGVVKAPADPALAAQLRALERRNKELADKFESIQNEAAETKRVAEKKEQDATVRTKLNKFKFADDQAAEDAFDILGSKVKRNEDGAFVGPDGTPIDQFIEEGLRSKPYLLAPKEVAGGGARNGGAVAHSSKVDIDSIKPGMSQADAAAAGAQILSVLSGQR